VHQAESRSTTKPGFGIWLNRTIEYTLIFGLSRLVGCAQGGPESHAPTRGIERGELDATPLQIARLQAAMEASVRSPASYPETSADDSLGRNL